MDLYSTFLVLMTTQSTLQYSFTFTQSHKHSYSASISSTLLFYEGQFRVQHLAQGHFGMQIFLFFLGRLGIELPTFRLEDNHSTPSATTAHVDYTYTVTQLFYCGNLAVKGKLMGEIQLQCWANSSGINCSEIKFNIPDKALTVTLCFICENTNNLKTCTPYWPSSCLKALFPDLSNLD